MTSNLLNAHERGGEKTASNSHTLLLGLENGWVPVPHPLLASVFFSICGLIDTAKRSSLTAEAIKNQVLIHNNWDAVNFSLDLLQQVLYEIPYLAYNLAFNEP